MNFSSYKASYKCWYVTCIAIKLVVLKNLICRKLCFCWKWKYECSMYYHWLPTHGFNISLGLIVLGKKVGLTLVVPREKITVLLIGNHSAGKSSFVNWWVGVSMYVYMQVMSIFVHKFIAEFWTINCSYNYDLWLGWKIILVIVAWLDNTRDCSWQYRNLTVTFDLLLIALELFKLIKNGLSLIISDLTVIVFKNCFLFTYIFKK